MPVLVLTDSEFWPWEPARDGGASSGLRGSPLEDAAGETLWELRDMIRPRGCGLVNTDYQARKEVWLFLFRNRVHIPLFFFFTRATCCYGNKDGTGSPQPLAGLTETVNKLCLTAGSAEWSWRAFPAAASGLSDLLVPLGLRGASCGRRVGRASNEEEGSATLPLCHTLKQHLIHSSPVPKHWAPGTPAVDKESPSPAPGPHPSH